MMRPNVTDSLRPARGRAWALAVVALLAMAVPARADLAGVTRDLAGLQAELAELRGIQLVQATPSDRAQFEVRLGQLEEELRRLTGRIEQLEFSQRTVETRLDQLIQDLDVRLSALEQGGVAAGGEGEPRQAQAPSESGPGTDGGPPAAQQADTGEQVTRG